ncbi:VOC family protein [Rhodococcus sp. DMU1]|uniref:VOC family protein n=1 Tax=Rhodococcus sp. DMU1 TaxID=2722825 RepID=UPI00143E62CC|nr:VOC family protein [Rhodococcus sp. DMU1]QIX53874.1 VOC family protein [Rhodococcus sp. DMU1]
MAYVQHIGMFVKDMDETIGFYERVFGMRVVADMDPGPEWNMKVINMADDRGHAITMISPGDSDAYREWKYKTWGVNHIGFIVDSMEETLALLEKEESVTEIQRLDFDGNPVAKFRDLNGTEIDVADIRYKIWDMTSA